jgi:hypothetical protein
MPYIIIIIRGCWFHIIVGKVHAPAEDEIEECHLLGCYAVWLL